METAVKPVGDAWKLVGVAGTSTTRGSGQGAAVSSIGTSASR